MALQYNTANTVTFRRVTLLNDPYTNELTGLPWVQGQDNRGFQYQITLDALPPGTTINSIAQGQVWFIDNETSAWRLKLWAGTVDNPITIASGNQSGINSYGNFYDTTTQSGVANTPYAMTLNTNVQSDGFTIISGSYLTNTYRGLYNLTYSAQFYDPGLSGQGTNSVYIWLRQDGTDVPWSSGVVSMGAKNPYILPSWNFVAYMDVGSTIQLMWASQDSTTVINAQSSPSLGPSIPSVTLTVNQID